MYTVELLLKMRDRIRRKETALEAKRLDLMVNCHHPSDFAGVVFGGYEGETRCGICGAHYASRVKTNAAK